MFAFRGPWGSSGEIPWRTVGRAACRQRGPEARLGFGTAARIWGLAEGQSPVSDPVHVVVPAEKGFRSTQRVQVHRTNRLASSDVTSVAGLPVTTVARTIIDLAGSLSAESVERVVDDALVRQLTTFPLLSGALGRNAHRGCRGGPLVRSALGLWSVNLMAALRALGVVALD